MSHQPERTEKNCLNCGTEVQGRFCQHCGQENIIPHQNFWSLTRHFIYDIFHFDGKFFDTLVRLLFRPGRVAREYVAGKRMTYLDPIRMYLFTSAVFFLFFFSLTENGAFNSLDVDNVLDRSERLEMIMVRSAEAKERPADSALQKELAILLDSTKRIALIPEEDAVADSALKDIDLNTGERLAKDSFRKSNRYLPVTYKGEKYRMTWGSLTIDSSNLRKGGWLERRIKQRAQEINQKYGDDVDRGASTLINSFLHQLPYLLFISLPFFALLLKLLYLRRKQFFYSDHAVFTLYHYIFSFILMLITLLLGKGENGLGWRVFDWLLLVTTLCWPVHLLLAMRRFYGQGWGKTLGKFFLLNFMGTIVLGILFALLALISFLM